MDCGEGALIAGLLLASGDAGAAAAVARGLLPTALELVLSGFGEEGLAAGVVTAGGDSALPGLKPAGTNVTNGRDHH